MIPWYARIAAKLVFSRLRIPYSTWRRVNLFTHGLMAEPKYAISVFEHHFRQCDFARKREGYVLLELGPGDSLLSALIARANGAIASYLVDVDAFATVDIEKYFATLDLLRAQGKPVPQEADVSDLNTLLRACNAHYLTRGVESLRSIPAQSVDFIYSHAVLEHVRRHEFQAVLNEFRRILRPDGVGSHRIDLTDHLGGGLNNLRIASEYWEAEWVARSGFYTNRLRFSEIVRLCKQTPFTVETLDVQRWQDLPLPLRSIANEFRHLDINDLLVKSFDLILRPSFIPPATRSKNRELQQVH